MTVAASDLVVANRGMIVAVGRYGARALAHLWPRLRFEDAQRGRARAGLPLLRNLVSTVLLLPIDGGRLVAGQPKPEKWEGRHLLRRIEKEALSGEGGLDLLSDALLRREEFGTAEGAGRAAYLANAVRSQRPIGDWLVQAAEQGRIDEHAPGSGVHRFTVYVLAALAEGPATALLWPLTMILRDRLEDRLGLEVVGLLSAGAYAQGTARRAEGANAHIALRELEFFSGEDADLSYLEPAALLEPWQGRRYFDRCYLLDSEKSHGARAFDETEIIVTTGNALEVFLPGNAPDVVAERVGPDDEFLHRYHPFGTLGSASTYIPIDQWQARNQYRFELEILESEFLKEQHQPLAEDAPVARFAARYVDLRGLVAEMVSGCPLSLLGQGASDGDVARLLRAAHLEQSLGAKGWPAFPLPEVRVDPAVARPPYRWQDPVEERSYRLPPDEWLQHLYQHYRQLGLGPDQAFPGDPQAAEYESTMLQDGVQPMAPPAGAPGMPAIAASRREDWFNHMVAAIEPPGDGQADAEPAGDAGREPVGIVPQFAAGLRREVIGLLEAEGQGLQAAIDWLRELSRSLRQAVSCVEDYQVRLEHALGGEVQAAARRAGSRRLAAFRRLLAGRPRPGSVLGRLLALAALVATSGYYILPHYALPFDLRPYPSLLGLHQWLAAHMLVTAIGLGVGVSALLFAAVLGVHRLRLRRAIRRIERDLTRELNLHVNWDVARAISEGDRGLLAGLIDEVVCQSEVLLEAQRGLRERHAELTADLAEALSRRQPFVRQPLAGLEDWEAQLQQAARPGRRPLLPPAVLSAKRDLAEGLFADYIASEVELAWTQREHDRQIAALEEEGSSRKERAQAGREARQHMQRIRERYRYARRGYRSLGDLLIATVEQAAQVQDIVPPRDLQLELLLRQRVDGFSPQSFLSELSSRAQVNLAWDREQLPRSMPVPLGLVSVEGETSFADADAAMDELGLERIVSFDPFAVTVLRLCHGLSLAAIPHFQAYESDFLALSVTERSPLAIAPQALSRTGEYCLDGEAPYGPGPAEAGEEAADDDA